MSTINRRYDIDWLRVIAIGLLLIYHIAICFQPWGAMIGFMVSDKPWGSLWAPMTMLNVWRIPLLFFVSGMGVYFAMQRRDWKQLIMERSRRILVPFIFGVFAVVPIHMYLWQVHYGMSLSYMYNPGHLWFLGNIFIYVLLLLPLFYFIKKNEDGQFAQWIKRILSHPLGLLPVAAAFVAEAIIVNPRPYELYAMTWHGFFLGFLAFVFGFCFMLAGDGFKAMMVKWRWLFLLLASVLFAVRITQYQYFPPSYHMAIESNLWIFTVFGFGFKHLNRPGKALNYLSQAAYPIYIIHMAFLYLGSLFILKVDVAAPVQFIMMVAFTFAGCFAFYELVIRRVAFLRPLFGLR